MGIAKEPTWDFRLIIAARCDGVRAMRVQQRGAEREYPIVAMIVDGLPSCRDPSAAARTLSGLWSGDLAVAVERNRLAGF